MTQRTRRTSGRQSPNCRYNPSTEWQWFSNAMLYKVVSCPLPEFLLHMTLGCWHAQSAIATHSLVAGRSSAHETNWAPL